MTSTVGRPASAGPFGSVQLLPLAIYSLLSIVLTWPLVAGIARDVPGDLGDSLLNMWILAWGAEHIPRWLTLQIGWSDFWNANIFYPEPLALALSEHLFGQSLQILPVYWLTGNIILCYNLLFISTFALSAFGTYLLVRDLTGDYRAAFIAGLVYGFLPYRIASIPHLQVLSSQWMPFALYGLNRYVTSGSRRALAVGTGALVMQNWSCGYYLLYFAPFVPLFLVYRMWTQRKLNDVRIWIALAGAAVVTLILSLPFLFPYQAAAARFDLQRPFSEVVSFSANVWSYATASENLTVFGTVLRLYPRSEGETFLGFVPWVLALIGLGGVIWNRTAPATASGVSRIVMWLSVIVVVTQVLALAGVVLFGGFALGPISARSPDRVLMQLGIALVLLLAISTHARSEAMRIIRSPVAFAVAATLLAIWLSLGPLPRTGNENLSGLGIYGVLYHYVPGFNAVRVPARYAMIAGLFLAVAAGYGTRRLPLRTSLFSLLSFCFLILMEGVAVPLEINRSWIQNEAYPPARVMKAAEAPPVYARVAALPSGSVITEFPFGDGAWEIRYVYYAAAHWKPITNGYSGNFPPSYQQRVAHLQRVSRDADAAWQALMASGSTHAIVHRNAFANVADADVIERWLTSRSATEVARFPDGDVLWQLPR